MYTSLQKLIPQAASKYNFTRQMKAIEICQEYRKIAPTLFPPAVLDRTFPKSYEEQILTIGVYDSMWAQQLTMQKHTILSAINKKFGTTAVKKISIVMCEEKTEQAEEPKEEAE